MFVRPLVLEHLEYLQLWLALTGAEITQILGTFKLPSLREVYLHNNSGSSSGNILPAIMISFYSSHLLEKFTLTGVITSDDELIQVLGYTVMHVLMLHPNHRNHTMDGINKIHEQEGTIVLTCIPATI